MTAITKQTEFPQYIEDIKEVHSIIKRTENVLPEKSPNLSNPRINSAIRFQLGKREDETFTIKEFRSVAYKVTLYLFNLGCSNRFENYSDTFIESE
ncbi:MAG: hypothetical protein ChlgKO_08320 [Chlamydiales bacterium]